MKRGQAVFCRICGIYIESRMPNIVEDLCQSQLCRRWDADNIAAAKSRKYAAALEERRHDLVEIACQQSRALQPELSQDPHLKIIVLPYLERNLTEPSPERRREVAESLLSLANTAYALNTAAGPAIEPALQPVEPDSPMINQNADKNANENARERRFANLSGKACGTCGGKCCNWGRDGAFLGVDKFREVLRNRPTSTPEEVVAEYVNRIPDLTFHDSCIFHGVQGCGLTRELRSFTCNSYLCVSLHVVQEGIDEDASDFLLAATNYRDVEAPDLKVYRIKIASDEAEQTLLNDLPYTA